MVLGLTSKGRATPLPPGVTAPPPAVSKLPLQEFTRLHRSIVPIREHWMDIPWETDLQEARGRAMRERKPLLMWVMDGHPLGCT